MRALIAAVVVLIGLLAVAAGVVYLTVEAHSLPSILGSIHGFTGHRTKRGIAALIIGGVLIVAGGSLALYRPRPRS